MANRGTLRRKLRKLRNFPSRFLQDSANPILRSLFDAFALERKATGDLPAPPAGEASSPTNLQEPSALQEPPWPPEDLRAALQACGLFDPDFYLTRYPDVAEHGLDPWEHYLEYGICEGRWPNSLFDPSYYASQAGLAATEPVLLHYAARGEALGLRPHRSFDPVAYRAFNSDLDPEQLRRPLRHFLRQGMAEGRAALSIPVRHPGDLAVEQDLRELAVTVVIPVFNGYEHVRRCVESVLLHTHLPRARVLLIDDASTDLDTRRLLQEYATLPCVTVLSNSENLGFTRTVNRGLRHARGRDVVLLNSDTVVSPRWLETLARAAYGAPNIATATALSDNAGAFSSPAPGVNPTHEECSIDAAARLCQRVAPCDVHFVPTGNGFCMYMRRTAIDAVGPLDEVNFPRGYGEENDWCMRAGEHGFLHVIALRAYVHHVNAATFGKGTKERMCRESAQVLHALHPDYTARVGAAFAAGTSLTVQRERFRTALAELRAAGSRAAPRPRVLFVISTRTGGTPLTNEDLMRGMSALYEPLLLTCDHRELQLWDCSKAPRQELAWHCLSEPVLMSPHTSREYDLVISDWLSRFNVELVHVRHIAWHSLGLVDAAKRLAIPVVFSFHDFYAACPSVNLTNGTDAWSPSGVTEPQICSPLWEHRDAEGVAALQRMDPDKVLTLWKRRMNATLAKCDAFVTTAHFAKQVLSDNLPVLRERREDFHVIAHGRNFDSILAPVLGPRPRRPLRVLIPGNINAAKGMNTILELLRLDQGRLLELHLVGNARNALIQAREVVNHGPYQREDFTKLVTQIQPDLGLVLSIWPETFCHTLTECWAAGLPVVGSELGAVGERIREEGIGWAVDPHDAVGIYELLRRIHSGQEDWRKQVYALTRWRQSTATWDVAAMASKYLDVYAQVTKRNRPLWPARQARPASRRQRVAVVVLGHYPDCSPTAHVRIATQIVRANAGAIEYEWVQAAELVHADVSAYDGVLICRNAGTPGVLAELAHRCEQAEVPMVLDLDDDLLGIPPDKDVRGVYAAFRPVLRELLTSAAITTVSTTELAERYASFVREVRVFENRLDPDLWFGDCAEEARDLLLRHVEDPLTMPLELGAGIRIIYMGSVTHDEDLALILPVIEALRATHDVTLYTIGVARELPPGVGRLAPPNPRFDRFVPWFRALAGQFDLAIAPLVESRFNTAKSSLKFMEYAAVGLPVVASRVGPYAEVVRDGQDGILVDNDVDAWLEALRALIDEPSARRRLAAAAQERARAEFTAQACAFDELFTALGAEREVGVRDTGPDEDEDQASDVMAQEQEIGSEASLKGAGC